MLVLIPRLTRPGVVRPDFNVEVNPHCEHTCAYTLDPFRLPIAEGVFVQPNAIDWNGPKRWSSDQKFFAYLREAPGHYNSLRFKWSPPFQFNYTVGFVPGCDIPAGYDQLVPRGVAHFGWNPQEHPIDPKEDWEEVKAAVANKTGAAFALISNCKTRSKRELYIDEFKRRYPHLLQLYGKCYDKRGAKCTEEECLLPNLRSHRFFFAFENAVCTNYVTEKFFRIKRLIVPVVLRRADYRRLLPDDAFIAVDDFESMSGLAAHLERLIADPSLYLRYFRWTRLLERRDSPRQLEAALCAACGRLYDDDERRSAYRNLTAFYSQERWCDLEFVLRLLERHTKTNATNEKGGN
ncbi:Glyco-tran-10-N domain-containing protein [Aphelenchoides fujianensis]|nr:Glyco-tran-10-N domain-containing protein [Aphelenchoides fujianensis]